MRQQVVLIVLQKLYYTVLVAGLILSKENIQLFYWSQRNIILAKGYSRNKRVTLRTKGLLKEQQCS